MIIKKHPIINDSYTDYIYEAFDIQNTEETVTHIPDNLDEINSKDWSVGVIYGSSGSGKSTLLRMLGDEPSFEFDPDMPLISNFTWMTPEEATKLLSSMGLSSVPSWLRPYRLLSNGEQYRARLAYQVSSVKEGSTIYIDEYTSVVDRSVAKSMSYALQKYIRKHNKKIVLATCHFDVMEWLMPDWTYSPLKGVLEWNDYLRQGRPEISLQVSRVESDTWDLFKDHHYLTEKVSKSCSFFLFTWGGIPIGINAVITQPSGSFKNGYRESRIVVLPDYQGLGLGRIISETIAAIYKSKSCRYFTKTVHPALGVYRNNSANWRPTKKNGRKTYPQTHRGNATKTKTRASYCHEYVGEPLYGYEELLLPVKDLRKSKFK